MIWKKKLGKKWISLLHLNEFNLKDGFENYIVAKIFDATSNDKKVWKGKKKKNTIQHAILILFAALFQTFTSLKFNINANTYEKS